MFSATFNPKVLRQYVGGFAWPTVTLFVVLWAVYLGALWLFAQAILPAWCLIIVSSVCNFYSFTVVHEAVHENIEGKSRGGPLTGLLGWLAGAMFLAPFPAVRVIHLTHHQHTNVPGKDPDYWVVGANNAVIFLRCLSIYPHYLYQYLFKLDRSATDLARSLVALIFYWGVALALLLSPLFELSLYGIVIPVFLGTGLTAWLFDWFPHHPHQDQSLAGHTRNYPGRILDIVLAGQNLHQVHHANPRIPFYRYAPAFFAAMTSRREDHQML